MRGADLSASRSRLALSYLEPSAPDADRALVALAMNALAAVSEPIHSTFELASMMQLLVARGFSALSDERPRDIAARYGLSSLRLGFGAPSERILVA